MSHMLNIKRSLRRSCEPVDSPAVMFVDTASYHVKTFRLLEVSDFSDSSCSTNLSNAVPSIGGSVCNVGLCFRRGHRRQLCICVRGWLDAQARPPDGISKEACGCASVQRCIRFVKVCLSFQAIRRNSIRIAISLEDANAGFCEASRAVCCQRAESLRCLSILVPTTKRGKSSSSLITIRSLSSHLTRRSLSMQISLAAFAVLPQ